LLGREIMRDIQFGKFITGGILKINKVVRGVMSGQTIFNMANKGDYKVKQ